MNTTRDIRLLPLLKPSPLGGVSNKPWPYVTITLSNYYSVPAVTVKEDKTYVWYLREKDDLHCELVRSEIVPSGDGGRYDVVYTSPVKDVPNKAAGVTGRVECSDAYFRHVTPVVDLIPRQHKSKAMVYQLNYIYV